MTKPVGSCRAWNAIRRRETGQWAENSASARFVGCTVVRSGLRTVSSPTDTEAALLIVHCVTGVASRTFGIRALRPFQKSSWRVVNTLKVSLPKRQYLGKTMEFKELDVPGLLHSLLVGQRNRLANKPESHCSRTGQKRAIGTRRELQVSLTMKIR